jgi:pimeloyl-ACP methyl ester carboxylesterase
MSTLLLTHGYTGSAHDWAKVVEPLSGKHPVITWDISGHGAAESTDDPAAYSVPLTIAEMARLLDRAGADRAVLVGHSMGGFLSLEFQLAHPERVAGLVLVDTGPGYRKAEPRDGWNRLAEKRAREFEAKGGKFMGLAHAARGILKQHDARVIDSLPSIRVPTLVIVGEKDEIFLGGSRYMAEKIPGAKLEIIPGAGHSPQETHVAEFLSVLESFLA